MTTYSTAQKLSLAGMVIGALMVVVGGCAPYWLVLDPDGFSFSSLVTKVVNANMNPFVWCIEVLGQMECRIVDLVITVEWLQSVRVTVAGSIVVGGLCGFISLCLACCTCCQRLIFVGVLGFLTAGAGIFGAVVFYKNIEVFTTSIFSFQITSLGWAFYVYCVGVGIMGLLSFVACFAAPEHSNNAVHGIVVSQPPPTQLAIISAPTAPQQQLYYGQQHPYGVPPV
ncbi:hypothetical protein ACOMHN_046191 [Nucella lapillus]